jgi:hypothetical protein
MNHQNIGQEKRTLTINDVVLHDTGQWAISVADVLSTVQ